MYDTPTPENAGKIEWDVIVIGTGMGGAVAGYALAKAGKSVLFCEKGKSHFSNTQSLKGAYAEAFFPERSISQQSFQNVLSHAGRWQEEIEDRSGSRVSNFVPFIGSGTGGSSALYGMALERFFPIDFLPRNNYPNEQEATLPENWPISYEELLPYYISAEQLFRVRGTRDLLRSNEVPDHFLPPQSLSAAAKELHDFLSNERGLHPYRLPIACELVRDCEYCQSFLCKRECKNDSARICLKPAIADFGAMLLDECEVLKLMATKNEVKEVVCHWKGRELTIKGKIVVLAANALETPRILLESSSQFWPNGLANQSGLVGMNLMRHFIDLYAIKPPNPEGININLKEIAFNDYYAHSTGKFGTIQSFGSLPPASIIADELEKGLRRNGNLLFAGSLFSIVKPAIKLVLSRIFSKRVILASIMEDLPYKDNYMTLSDKIDSMGRKRIVIKYRIKERERARIKLFRKQISGILKPYPFMLIKQAENNQRIAHVCGTCRFGGDPKESVLDSNNRAHGVENLYVVDSSFFPSSGGTNPALTIAANALRVADHIKQQGN